MKIIYSIYKQNKIFSGIYKITFPNGKNYIGQSSNIIRRIREHNSGSKQIVDKAIQKYGKIEEFELLEEISPENKDLMNERERYYIKKYQSLIHQNGYNITIGGEGFTRDYKLPYVEQIVKLLQSNQYSYKEISDLTGQSTNVINSINHGYTYYNENLVYPLKKIKIYHSTILTEQEIREIQKILREEYWVKMEDIAKDYEVNLDIIYAINKGKSPYYYKDKEYPIRKKNLNFCKFSQQQIEEIINLLSNSKMTQIEIAEKFNCDRKLIGQINSGKKYFQTNINYPIRKR